MVELKRYKWKIHSLRYGGAVGTIVEDKSGEYVKFDDIKEFLHPLHDPLCFHECPVCNTRCNCNGQPCSHCSEKISIKQFMLETSPKVYDWKDSEKCDKIEISKYDIEGMGNCIPDAIFYWYVSGSYEGDGALIAVKNGRWYSKSLAHCSCYGPLEDFANDFSKYNRANLDDLLASGTDEWRKEYAPLAGLARAHGYN